MYHLYEIVLESGQMWIKLQASCSSEEQATTFFSYRFGGNDPDPLRPDLRYVSFSFRVPRKLSECSDHIFNWEAINDRLPTGWDDQEFRLARGPYPWCETLSDNCDCHGAKGRLDATYCSDLGLHDEAAKRASKSRNVRHLNNIQSMEETIARSDETRRAERLQREQHTPPQGVAPVAAKPAEPDRRHRGITDTLPANAINVINRLVARGFYCSIEGRHHPYGEQAIRKSLASLTAACAQISTWDGENRDLAMSRMGDIAAHWLQRNQSEECAQRLSRGGVDIPDILYKYIPVERIGNGAPDSLRATQLLALNDDMECNVTTMKGSEQGDTLAFLAIVQSKLEGHLGIEVPWEELLERSIRYGDLRLSTFIQEYLNPRVGVVSFTTDILVPTMWAHYARNTGIVVGYDAEILRSMGFELRPMIYSEIAPTYQPSKDDIIRLSFVDRERMEQRARLGETSEGWSIMADADLAEMNAGWKSLSRLLFVKGISWAYEKEVRLLVDLQQARDTGKSDSNGWPVKAIDPPPDAIREIYRGANTRDADVERAVEVARGENKSGLFVGHVSSHAFRIQKTGGGHH